MSTVKFRHFVPSSRTRQQNRPKSSRIPCHSAIKDQYLDPNSPNNLYSFPLRDRSIRTNEGSFLTCQPTKPPPDIKPFPSRREREREREKGKVFQEATGEPSEVNRVQLADVTSQMGHYTAYLPPSRLSAFLSWGTSD